MKAFDAYYNLISKSKDSFAGQGLLLDIHGHSHTTVRTELGYLLSAQDLDNNRLDPQKSSIRALASRVTISFEELLHGPHSFGGLLEAQHNSKETYYAVPSPTYIGPGNGHPYFKGGFTVAAEGSRDGDYVDAIQVESPQSYRSYHTRPVYAKDLATSIVKFMKQYYSLETKLKLLKQSVASRLKKSQAHILHAVHNADNKHARPNHAAIIICSMVAGGILIGIVIISLKRRVRKTRQMGGQYELFGTEV